MEENIITNMYDTKIKIVVQSKKPEILKIFKDTFLPTTAKFTNLSLEEITGENYGAVEINKILIPKFFRMAVISVDHQV